MSALDFFAENLVFTVEEFATSRESRGRSRQTTANLLGYHVAEGHIVRVHRGLYATPTGAEDAFLVASKVASGAVLAYHTALQYRGCAHSVWHRYLVLARGRRVSPVYFNDMEIVAVMPPTRLRSRDDLGGFVTAEPHGLAVVRVTSHERTLVDVLDRPELGGGWEEIWRSLAMISFVDVEAVIEYTLRLGTALTTARVGYYLEQNRERWMLEEHHLHRLERHIPRSPQYFDRTLQGGALTRRWNLYIPAEIRGEGWEELR